MQLPQRKLLGKIVVICATLALLLRIDIRSIFKSSRVEDQRSRLFHDSASIWKTYGCPVCPWYRRWRSPQSIHSRWWQNVPTFLSPSPLHNYTDNFQRGQCLQFSQDPQDPAGVSFIRMVQRWIQVWNRLPLGPHYSLKVQRHVCHNWQQRRPFYRNLCCLPAIYLISERAKLEAALPSRDNGKISRFEERRLGPTSCVREPRRILQALGLELS